MYDMHQIEQESARDKFTEAVIQSNNSKKIIVSGPGTGKTYIFHRLLETKNGNCLALTFINNLAEKLKKDLKGLARSCTFHSYCTSLLHTIKHEDLDRFFNFFPKLELIIRSDARIIYNLDPDFGRNFRKLERSSNNIIFFKKRAGYYNAVSFDDAVFRVLEYFEKNPNQIPTYEQIVVDEYQDFNKLEVVFIDLLATKSPILIVGDDDQALYLQLKNASPNFIREKFQDPGYRTFPLPFCSRCPEVVINTLYDIVRQTKKIGRLKERIEKDYYCYLPDKELDNKKYPQITYAHCSVQSRNFPYVAKFIDREINKLISGRDEKEKNKGDYTVLITGPKRYLKQIDFYLKNKKEYVLYHRKLDPEFNTIKKIDGYKILLNDQFSNLGWRILIEREDDKNIKDLLIKNIKDSSKRIYDYLPKEFIEKHISNLEFLKKLKDTGEISQEQKDILEKFFNSKIEKLKLELIEDRDLEDAKNDESNSSQGIISVMLTTYIGCKGISADYVFILGLNEGNLPRNNRNPSDIEICQFIVALTRTIKKCYLISVSRFAGKPEGNRSVFIDWIDKKRIKPEKIDTDYWKRNII